MRNYRELTVFKESKHLAILIHKLSLSLPKFELYEEGSQIRRSSKSVTISIVEAYGRRRYKGDLIKYLVYAIAECDETINHLDFLFETGSFADRGFYDELKSDYNILSRRLNKFIKWVEEEYQPINGS